MGHPPPPRAGHTAVWTGEEMLIWGGYDGDAFLDTGGRYSPSTNTWAVISSGTDCPAPRSAHGAVWTGNSMLVWGGTAEEGGLGGTRIYFNTGAQYDPSANGWTPMSVASPCPVGRNPYAVVWTGEEMFIWGGYSTDAYLDTGGLFSPSVNSWRTLFRPGDANGDGVVSIGEVQQVINMFLGLIPAGNGADCNGDGVISIGEVQKVVNAFLGMAVSC